MPAFLARIRAVPPLKLALIVTPIVLVVLLLLAAVLAPGEFVSLLGLLAYIVAVIGLAMAVTFVVVKVSPSKSAKEQAQRSS